MDLEDRKKAYNCDVTYGTNKEFAFDYLRDNIALEKSQLVQKEELFYAIIDEVDSILLDEAESPLIISRETTGNEYYYMKANAFVRRLKGIEVIRENVKNKKQKEEIEKYDYIIDLNCNSVSLTNKGILKAEENFQVENYNDIKNLKISYFVNNALMANGLMKKDKDYIVKNDEIYVVDKYTGRVMYGKKFNKGLHQAIEAKEHIKISGENKVVATITFQNYFKMYHKLSGMTGTAEDSRKEFEDVYGLEITNIKPHNPIIRKDYEDIIYNSEEEKIFAIIDKIKEIQKTRQPILIGTISVEKSEKISQMLKKERINHFVLNAKNEEEEAKIIANAGKAGNITIATNMAGRGTDIKLGNDKVTQTKGLMVIGTERHMSKRIDKQLRGRSGRQGEPRKFNFLH